MAYGNIYWMTWGSVEGKAGYLYIDKKDYGGAATQLKVRTESIELNYGFQGWEDPVIGMSLAFSIVNDREDYYELMPLLKSEEKLYKVRLVNTVPSSYTLFEGFINCEPTSQRMLQRQDIRMTASSYLSKLEYIHPTSIDTLSNLFFINTINEILLQTGLTNNIRINCSLYSRWGTISATKTLFNNHTYYSELFWEDNVKRRNSLAVLRSILGSFQCYLYWWDGYWYIEKYDDLWTVGTQNYVEYDYTRTYGDIAGGSVYDQGTQVQTTKTLTDFQTFKFTGGSQTHHFDTGSKEVHIKLNDRRFLNMIMGDLTNSEDNAYGITPYPNIRTWQNLTSVLNFWLNKGVPKYKILNSIEGYLQDPDWDNMSGGSGDNHKYTGLFTRFNVTKNSDSEGSTVLNISFKYGRYLIGWLNPWRAQPSDISFTFHWYLRVTPGNGFLMKQIDETWQVVNTSENGGVQEIVVSGSEFKEVGDSGWIWTEVSFEVPLGDVTNLSDGDKSLALAIGTVKAEYDGTTEYAWGHYGDLKVTVSEPEMDNDITGTANTSFLTNKDVEMDFVDISNLNYKNGVYYQGEKTVDWTKDGVNYYSLVDWMLKNKFKIYNVTRQRITGIIRTSQRLKPLQMMKDSKQADLPFLLLSFVFNVTRDEYNITLYEYDNTTVVNIV